MNLANYILHIIELWLAVSEKHPFDLYTIFDSILLRSFICYVTISERTKERKNERTTERTTERTMEMDL